MGSIMKSKEFIDRIFKSDRREALQFKRRLQSNLNLLERLYKKSQYDTESPLYNCTPAQTVAAFVEAVGYESSVEIVASLVNYSAWDGRIFPSVKEWANTQENSWDEEASGRLGLYSERIHIAHLNQIAEAMMKMSAI